MNIHTKWDKYVQCYFMLICKQVLSSRFWKTLFSKLSGITDKGMQTFINLYKTWKIPETNDPFLQMKKNKLSNTL